MELTIALLLMVGPIIGFLIGILAQVVLNRGREKATREAHEEHALMLKHAETMSRPLPETEQSFFVSEKPRESTVFEQRRQDLDAKALAIEKERKSHG